MIKLKTMMHNYQKQLIAVCGHWLIPKWTENCTKIVLMFVDHEEEHCSTVDCLCQNDANVANRGADSIAPTAVAEYGLRPLLVVNVFGTQSTT